MEIPKNWTFKSEEVATGFDKHVRETLPWYELATEAVAHVARHYINENGVIYDIGASTGNIGKALKTTIEARNAKLIAIEPSMEMADLYKGGGELVIANGENVDYESFDVAICFLSIMFIETNKRDAFMKKLRDNRKKGGAIIIFDKMEAIHGYFSTVMYRLTLAGKIAQGITPEQVMEKELSLSGVQRPINEKLLGNDAINWFRFGDFAGWIICD